MPKFKNRFLEYIYDNFYDQIHNCVLGYVINHKTDLLRNTPSGSYAYFDIEIEDMDFKQVYLEEKDNNRINFDIIIEPYIGYQYNYYEKRNRLVDGDSCSGSWITVSCTGIIGKKLEHFSVYCVDLYSKKKLTKPLNGDLVPYIDRENYDARAEEILTKAYGASYTDLVSIDAYNLADKLGLKIIVHQINKEGTIFGEVFFKDCEAEFFDEQSNSYKKELIKANTIVVDDRATSDMSFGCENITIAHECVHFVLHKKAFMFAQMINKDLKYIQCESNCTIKNIETENRESWMEIQANAIGPRILMPANSIRKTCKDMIDYLKIEDSHFDILKYTEKIIRYLAEYFGVTNYAMRKRLIDLGMRTVSGTLCYVDGGYVPAFTYKEETLKDNQSYVISKKEALINISLAAAGRDIDYISDFIFVENHICLNDEKYISFLNGVLQLTDYARHHVDECCLVFNIDTKYNLTSTKNKLYTFCYLCRGISINGITYQASIDKTSSKSAVDNATKLSNQHALVVKLQVITTMTRCNALKFLMKEMKVSEAELAEDLRVEPKTIQRYRNDEKKTIFKDTLVAICVSLKLPPEISEIFITKCATVGFNYNNERDFVLNSVIHGFYSQGIEYANEALASFGQPPLVIEK